MLEVLKKIWSFAGVEKKEINKSLVTGFFFAVFHMFQVGAIYYIIVALVGQDATNRAAWTALLFLGISIIGRAVTNYYSQLMQTHAGYFMVANKRIAIGNKLKSVPMGYFNENHLGEITGVATSILEELENTGPMVLVSILSGFINALVFTVMVLIYDFRIGILVLAGTAAYLWVTSVMQRKSMELAPKRQEATAKLVAAVLEHVQGMGVIKAFNLTGKGDQRVRNALEYSRESNVNLEKLFTPYTILQGMALHLFSVIIMLVSVLLYLDKGMTLANTLMCIIISFMVFAQIESAGSGMAILRIVSSSIEHTNRLDEIPELDSAGRDIRPKKHDITFDHVSFSYEKKKILQDVSICVPDKTTTAIIGESGSGKTTLCNLAARFWDVDSGSIKMGGTDIREYTLESLMDQISMVFQNVYLFADTIENNIKFGKPQATRKEVAAAAEKACCAEFIEKLPNGYDTIIGEGGGTLSGGEKQRISIARAILKDAPVIILDEATANVDPENEAQLQKAIEALMKDKTIIMIAHRLKTVRRADQILVVDGGKIVQRGTHEELLAAEGIYKRFIEIRKAAESWRIK